MFITRDLQAAKKRLKDAARRTQRCGITASSGAKRLRKYGVWVKKGSAADWFLNGKEDVRLSYYLEETATEFDIQGLELDWSVVCWDANLRFNGEGFEYYNFKGTKWQKVSKEENMLYLKNSYRVLLTRARQGFIIFVPIGDIDDDTMRPDFYNGVYRYLRDIGIQEV